jgi:hypothetical protein
MITALSRIRRQIFFLTPGLYNISKTDKKKKVPANRQINKQRCHYFHVERVCKLHAACYMPYAKMLIQYECHRYHITIAIAIAIVIALAFSSCYNCNCNAYMRRHFVCISNALWNTKRAFSWVFICA